MSITQTIKRAIGEELTDTELKLIAPGTAVVLYHELASIGSIRAMLARSAIKCVAILYEITSQWSGHWTALWEGQDGLLYFFDSYGFHYDEELKFSRVSRDPILSKLIAQDGRSVDVSPYHLQETENDVDTCGRWTGLRLRFRHLSHDRFAALFPERRSGSNALTGDEWVTALTLLTVDPRLLQ